MCAWEGWWISWSPNLELYLSMPKQAGTLNWHWTNFCCCHWPTNPDLHRLSNYDFRLTYCIKLSQGVDKLLFWSKSLRIPRWLCCWQILAILVQKSNFPRLCILFCSVLILFLPSAIFLSCLLCKQSIPDWRKRNNSNNTRRTRNWYLFTSFLPMWPTWTIWETPSCESV